MKKIYSIALLLFVVLFANACSKSVEYPTFYAEQTIETIEIIKVKDYPENALFYYDSELEYVVIEEIDEVEAFIEDFLLLDFFTVYNPSDSMPSGYYSIKFNYSNGAYEVVDYCGYFLYEPLQHKGTSRFIYCNANDYYDLVGCYLGYEIETSDIYEIRGKK
jgi:hypothetical protein